MARSLLLTALLLSSLHATAARAQSCAMLPPGTPPSGQPADAAARGRARDSVSETLTRAEVTVLPAEETERRLAGAVHAECAQLECGGSVARTLGVDFAVLVTVWAPRGTPTSVSIALISADDSVGGESEVQEGDVVAAAGRALTTALQRWQASRMGFVEVSSDPPGAEVRIDGQTVGVTPIRRLVVQGERAVRVSLEGYEPVERTVDVVATQSLPVEVTLVEAVAIEPDPPPPSLTRSEAHWANYVIGGALIAGGVGAAITPIHTLARLGECADDPRVEGVCATEVQFGAVSGILTGVAVAALAVGVVFLVAAPITVEVQVSPTEAGLQVSGAF